MNLTSLTIMLDRLRVIPRLLMAFYIWLTYSTSQWFFALSDPNAAQAAFSSAVIGAGAAWFGLYVNSGPRAQKRDLTESE